MSKIKKILLLFSLGIAVLFLGYTFLFGDTSRERDKEKKALILEEYLSEKDYFSFLQNKLVGSGECYIPEQRQNCVVVYFTVPKDNCEELDILLSKDLENNENAGLIKFRNRTISLPSSTYLERNSDGSCDVSFAIK